MTAGGARRSLSVTRSSLVPAWLLAAALAGEAPAAATASATITAAGGERSVWLIRTSQRAKTIEGRRVTGGEWINTFACQSRGGGKLEAARVVPQLGRIARCAVSGSQLFVFFDDGTHHSYSKEGRRIEIDLPDRAIPEAVAGMTGGGPGGLYAIVRHAVGKEVIRRVRRAEAATRPAGDVGGAASRTAPDTGPSRDGDRGKRAQPPPPTESAPAIDVSRPAEIDPVGEDASGAALDLLVYDGGRWRHVAPIEALPDRVRPDRLWLCASPEAVYILWADVEPGEDVRGLSCVSWRIADRAWAPVEPIELGAPLTGGAALYAEPRVSFAANLRGSATAPAAVAQDSSWRVWTWLGDQWEAGAPLDFSPRQGEHAPAPAQTAVAAFGGDVFVAVVGVDDTIHVGTWAPEGGAARKPLAKTDVFNPPRRPLIDPWTRGWLGPAIVITVIALVFWKRQSSLATAVPLPEGVVLASYGKRLAAAVIDLVPALVATSWLWYGPAVEYSASLPRTGFWREAAWPPPPDALLLGWALARVVYVVYCGAFEYAWGLTPGKWLLGCRVLNEQGEPATLRQTVVRNMMRLLELEPYLQVWPLLLIVFFTRNRQRLGDLLARTVVVERGIVAPADGDDESDGGPT